MGCGTVGRKQYFVGLVFRPMSKSYALVAQLDRASVFGTEGWGFESLRVYSSQYETLENNVFPGFFAFGIDPKRGLPSGVFSFVGNSRLPSGLPREKRVEMWGMGGGFEAWFG